MGGLFGLLFWWVTGGAPVPVAIPPVCIRGLTPSPSRVTFGEHVEAGVTFAPLVPAVRFGEPEAC